MAKSQIPWAGGLAAGGGRSFRPGTPQAAPVVRQRRGNRYQWIAPLCVTSRRRFSPDPEQRWLAELAGWFRNEIAPDKYVDAGSYCMFDQLIWEDKWPNPRSADELGCGTRHFVKLDLFPTAEVLFICLVW